MKKMYLGPIHWFLRVWLYLEIRSLRYNQWRWRHNTVGWASPLHPNMTSKFIERREEVDTQGLMRNGSRNWNNAAISKKTPIFFFFFGKHPEAKRERRNIFFQVSLEYMLPFSNLDCKTLASRATGKEIPAIWNCPVCDFITIALGKECT